MRIFVTGGSGFIGGHVVTALSRAHTVLALARSDRAAAAVQARGAEPVRGELGAVDASALSGVDVVVHAAAFVEEYGTREQFWQANVEGTRQLLEVARGAGVGRFIHIGTEAALFTGNDLLNLDESTPLPPASAQRFLYSETKAEAERLVRAAVAPGFVPLVLRPRLVWGPGDTSVLPAIRKLVESGRWSWMDGGEARTSTTHVVNLVAAVERALVAGTPGEAYFIADEGELSLREFLTALLGTQGVVLPDRSVPGWLARGSATVVEGVWRGLRLSGAPPMVAFTTTMMSRSVTVRTDKARAELGWTPRISREAGLAGMSS